MYNADVTYNIKYRFEFMFWVHHLDASQNIIYLKLICIINLLSTITAVLGYVTTTLYNLQFTPTLTLKTQSKNSYTIK